MQPHVAVRWRRRCLLWLLALIGYGCTARIDAPCLADDDCRAESEVCMDGRCTAQACSEGEQRACEAMNAPGCVGVRICSDGVFGGCVGPDETCDGLDNDCDGTTDEPFSDLGDRCESGQGACVDIGTIVCDPDTGATMCSAPARFGEPERCDGLDNDCDGATDEAIAATACEAARLGPCAAGTTTCVGGETVCTPMVEPRLEVCDGVDNDCDGAIDDVDGLGGACRAGLGGCMANGAWACGAESAALVCDAVLGAPADEVCNGVDDDCNGQIDDVDGVGARCDVGLGACAAEGEMRCGPNGLVCDATPDPPGLELCGNRIDDDCDGEIDDPVSCLAGCGNGRRDEGETCDDGNAIAGDGCSALCAVEPGFTCLEGPLDTPVAIDGVRGCAGWMAVDVPEWLGGYGVAYAGGAIAVSADPPRYAAAYAVKTVGPDGRVDLDVGLVDGALVEAETREAAIEATSGRFDLLDPGAYEVTFPDGTCADNDGILDLEFRTLDDCRPACEGDVDCRYLGAVCVEGRCMPPEPACGDAHRDPNEGCDDGNLADDDGCSAECEVEPGYVCQPVEPIGPIDVLPLEGFPWPAWRVLDDGVTLLQQPNALASHVALRLPISTRYTTRFTIEVVGLDDDFVGWTIGGGLTPLTAPEQPYLLFSWKHADQPDPAGLATRGLRVGHVTGPPDVDTLWNFAGESLEMLAAARTLGRAAYRKHHAYEIGIIGDAERLEVYVDGVLEFELADVPLGDGTLGLYVNSQDAVLMALVAPRAIDLCALPEAD